jgi:hypothetical protein
MMINKQQILIDRFQLLVDKVKNQQINPEAVISLKLKSLNLSEKKMVLLIILSKEYFITKSPLIIRMALQQFMSTIFKDSLFRMVGISFKIELEIMDISHDNI